MAAQPQPCLIFNVIFDLTEYIQLLIFAKLYACDSYDPVFSSTQHGASSLLFWKGFSVTVTVIYHY